MKGTRRVRRAALSRFVICHFLPMPSPCIPEKQKGDQEHEERKKLAARKWSGQRGVRHTENLADDAHDRVEEEKATGGEAIRFAEPETNRDQADEKQDSFERRFVNLAGMAWSENVGQNFANLRIRPSGVDNCRDRVEIWVQRRALVDCSLRLIGIVE